MKWCSFNPVKSSQRHQLEELASRHHNKLSNNSGDNKMSSIFHSDLRDSTKMDHSPQAPTRFSPWGKCPQQNPALTGMPSLSSEILQGLCGHTTVGLSPFYVLFIGEDCFSKNFIQLTFLSHKMILNVLPQIVKSVFQSK
jgi:hypothetical protein